MKRVFLVFIILTFTFATEFPPLSGRVVDRANLISSDGEKLLISTIKKEEQQSDVYLVVATVKSINGEKISDYAVKLGRHWGIGEKGKDNGVLLLVAPNERLVNISTGYGIEGVLTDAISRDIIQNEILPKFKRKKYEEGIISGVNSIFEVLKNEYDTMTMLKKALNHGAIFFETRYPQDTSFDLTNYSPRKLFTTIFIGSFFLAIASVAMVDIPILFLVLVLTSAFSFCFMIVSLLFESLLSNSFNYFLLLMLIGLVGYVSYKNRDYNPNV